MDVEARSGRQRECSEMARILGWIVMTFLALAVACYAVALLALPEFRPSLVRTLIAERPVAAIAHFAGSALALAIGTFQLNSWLRSRFGGGHRWLGRLYVAGVLAGGISGFVLSVQSSGGPSPRPDSHCWRCAGLAARSWRITISGRATSRNTGAG
jgi:uncharacterized membrane protein